MTTRLCDLVSVLKDNVKIEFSVVYSVESILFSGKKDKFLQSIHFHAFQTEPVDYFDLSGNWLDGYVAHINIVNNLWD